MRWFWYLVGYAAAGLGLLGVLLPIMPTVPFLILAVYAFARSSPQLRQKILAHPVYGPPVLDWQERGAIGRKIKLYAITAMTFSVGIALWLELPTPLIVSQVVICTAVAIFIVTRPED